MSSRWARVKSLFMEVEEQPPEARERWLREAVAGDSALFDEVWELLEVEESEAAFIDEGAVKPIEESLAGLTIGKYRVRERIGEGGMGAVWLADEQMGEETRPVALKVLKRGMDTEAIVSRFEHERRVLASLSHPNIAALFDGGALPDGRPYLVMEYVKGVSLLEYCDTHAFSIRERLALFKEVCLAVDAAHRNLIIHRDLKPSNILVTEDGVPKLLDFGIAKMLEQDQRLTRTGLFLLTPDYASPEQMRGEPVTTATDVYALGVVLYELLTGRRPPRAQVTDAFAALTPPSRGVTEERLDGPETAAQIAALRTSDVAGLRAQLKGEIDTIVMKALSAEQEKRYGSALQFGEDVGRYLDGFPVLARRASLLYVMMKFMMRRRLLALGLLIALLGPISFAITRTITAQATLQEQLRAEALRDRATLEADAARQTLEFVTGVIEKSIPEAAPGQPSTLKEVLVRAEENLDGETSPEIRAQLLRIIGRLRIKVGKCEDAKVVLEEAYALQSGLLAPDDPRLAPFYTELGHLAKCLGDPGQARRQFERALDSGVDDLDSGRMARIEAYLGLARIERNDLEHETALNYLDQAGDEAKILDDYLDSNRAKILVLEERLKMLTDVGDPSDAAALKVELARLRAEKTE